jgi:hypothetical protein
VERFLSRNLSPHVGRVRSGVFLRQLIVIVRISRSASLLDCHIVNIAKGWAPKRHIWGLSQMGLGAWYSGKSDSSSSFSAQIFANPRHPVPFCWIQCKSTRGPQLFSLIHIGKAPMGAALSIRADAFLPARWILPKNIRRHCLHASLTRYSILR